jgi:hypothetical protein
MTRHHTIKARSNERLQRTNEMKARMRPW